MFVMAKRHKDEVTRVTYRVDVIVPTGGYVEYTSRRGVAKGMATSLADHLKRNGAGGRMVELPSGEVLDEWARKAPASPDTERDKIQALRDALPKL
jgi:hypothetical protein